MTQTSLPLIDHRSIVRVNLGILATAIVGVVGGTLYLTKMNTSIDALQQSTVALRMSLDRNTEQMAKDGRTIAILETLVQTIDRRLAVVEAKTK